MIGVGLSIVQLAVRQLLGGTFSPIDLFTTGVNGAWYDPSDTTTLFKNAEGTTPVTAVEQPVGLMLDKSKGLVLGAELTTNGDFTTDTSWSKGAGCAITGGRLVFTSVANGVTTNQVVAGLAGETYAEITIVVASVTAGQLNVQLDGGVGGAIRISSPGTYTYRLFKTLPNNNSVYIVAAGTTTAEVDSISVKKVTGNHAFNGSGNSANFPVLSARYNQYLSTETLTTQNVTTVAANYTLSFTGTGSITLSGTATGTYSAGTHTITCTAGTLTSTVSGTVTKADLRVANDALNQPAYQRVNTSTDYDTVGFKPYLRFNDPARGTNNWLQTNSIDFTATDKMFVSAGVRKLSDAAIGVLSELSDDPNSNSGAWGLYAPGGTVGPTAGSYMWWSRGSAVGALVTPTGYTPPISNVLTAIGNISGDSVILRSNGIQVASAGTDQGTGNYGNYPLYIGARAGSSLWLNCRLYGLVVAGKQASAAEITSTETYLNQKTGAY